MNGRMYMRSGPVRLASAVACAAVLAVAAGCGQNSEEGTTEVAEQEVTDREVAERISEHMAAQGRESVAEIVLDEEETTITRLDTPYLDDWAVYRIDYDGASREVQHIVASSEQRSLFLRAHPEAFAELLQADGVSVEDADTAVVVAQDYLYTTRPTDHLSYVVEDTGDIRLHDAATEEERARIEDEYGDLVQPPRAEPDNGGYAVTAYIVYDTMLQERTVTFRGDGTIGDDTEILAEDLPVPISL